MRGDIQYDGGFELYSFISNRRQPLLIKKTAVRVKKILSANELNAQDVEVIGQFFNSLILAELNGMQ